MVLRIEIDTKVKFFIQPKNSVQSHFVLGNTKCLKTKHSKTRYVQLKLFYSISLYSTLDKLIIM